MKPSPKTIKRRLRELRKLIEDPTASLMERRIAYAMEEASRWATEDTSGWGTLAAMAKSNAKILGAELLEDKAK